MFIEITRGRSFKGLAQYCLHDADRSNPDHEPTSDRVDFVETRNLASNDPQVAWRTMAATHYMQDELKERAGVGKGGRKDGKPVGHLLIGWRDDEAEAQVLNRVQMVAAANGALRAIDAQDRQAMIVAHTDTQHPHCHVIINLIGEDGRLKKNWKEREKLSKFALEQEIRYHGEPIVKKRARNWEDREAGETPEPVKKKARHLYELEKAAAKDESLRKFAEQHKAELLALEQAKQAQGKRQQDHRDKLRWVLDERKRRTIDETEQRIRKSKTEVRKATRERWEELQRKQESERAEFEQKEATIKGSVANAMSMIDWRSLLRKDGEDRRRQLSKAFQVLTSEATRREIIQKQQQAEKDNLRVEQRKREDARADQLRLEESERIRQQREAYVLKAAAMKERQQARQEELRLQQQELTRQRNEALEQHRQQEAEAKRQRLLEQERQAEADRQASEHQQVEEPEPATNTRIRRERKEREPREPRHQPDEQQQMLPINDAAQEEQQRREEEARAEQARQDDFEQRMMEQLEQRSDRSIDDDRER